MSQFHWLMKNLCAPTPQIESCPILFPDTAFYKDGVALELIKTDPDTGLLTSVKQESKLTWEKITQSFITVVRDRRRFVKKA
jgi:hypothetical protein